MRWPPNMRRLGTCLLAALVAYVVPLFAAAPTIGQTATCTNSSATCTMTIASGLTTGSGLAILIGQIGTGTDTAWTVSDGGINTYTQWSTGVVRSTNGRACTMLLATNITTTGGALTPVATETGTASNYRAIAIEIVGMKTSSAADVQGGLGETTGNTSHPQVGTGLNTLTDVLMLGWAGTSGTNTTFTHATGFSDVTFTATDVVGQSLSTAAARSNETATWTNMTAREAANCLISLQSTTSSGATARRGTLLGVLP